MRHFCSNGGEACTATCPLISCGSTTLVGPRTLASCSTSSKDATRSLKSPSNYSLAIALPHHWACSCGCCPAAVSLIPSHPSAQSRSAPRAQVQSQVTRSSSCSHSCQHLPLLRPQTASTLGSIRAKSSSFGHRYRVAGNDIVCRAVVRQQASPPLRGLLHHLPSITSGSHSPSAPLQPPTVKPWSQLPHRAGRRALSIATAEKRHFPSSSSSKSRGTALDRARAASTPLPGKIWLWQERCWFPQ